MPNNFYYDMRRLAGKCNNCDYDKEKYLMFVYNNYEKKKIPFSQLSEKKQRVEIYNGMFLCVECKYKHMDNIRVYNDHITDAILHSNFSYVRQKKIDIGMCNKCNCYVKDPRTFEFDHLEHSLKKASVYSMCYSSSINEIEEEMKKCQLLCYSCHKDKTMAERQTPESQVIVIR